MNEQNRIKFNWQSALSAMPTASFAIALAVGVCAISDPAQSMPEAEDSWQVAQVGVRSRINSPTPLNLRPQTHIPLPTNSRSSDYYRHSGYRGDYYRHDEYGYGHHHHHHHGHHRGDRRNRGPVIIINPASSSSYSNYSSQDSYIRVIRK